ncbi:MAG: hypothetical protein LBI26_02210 [Holosporales bacterium]|jgi:hypothetical protein|nr:hypothetical protein [Holosporales bacterium]
MNKYIYKGFIILGLFGINNYTNASTPGPYCGSPEDEIEDIITKGAARIMRGIQSIPSGGGGGTHQS